MSTMHEDESPDLEEVAQILDEVLGVFFLTELQLVSFKQNHVIFIFSTRFSLRFVTFH